MVRPSKQRKSCLAFWLDSCISKYFESLHKTSTNFVRTGNTIQYYFWKIGHKSPGHHCMSRGTRPALTQPYSRTSCRCPIGNRKPRWLPGGSRLPARPLPKPSPPWGASGKALHEIPPWLVLRWPPPCQPAHRWKGSRPGWVGLWAACSGGSCSNWMVFKVASNPNHSVSRRLHDLLREV